MECPLGFDKINQSTTQKLIGSKARSETAKIRQNGNSHAREDK
jgi:hypothetical protein